MSAASFRRNAEVVRGLLAYEIESRKRCELRGLRTDYCDGRISGLMQALGAFGALSEDEAERMRNPAPKPPLVTPPPAVPLVVLGQGDFTTEIHERDLLVTKSR